MEMRLHTEARGNAVAPLGFADSRGGVTTLVYRKVLNQHLSPILRFGAMFMHDNALMHTANVIRDWLQQNGIDVKIGHLITLI
jgi:hypothetical protein